MEDPKITPQGVAFNGRTYAIVDALTMPAAERQWMEEWRAAGLSAVNCCVAVWENAAETMALLGTWRELIAKNADLCAIATSVGEIEAIRKSGRTAVLLGFQNTAPVEHNLDLFGVYRGLGVCIMQLTYNLQNYIGCGYWEAKDTGISSRFGKNALEEMAKVGILVDLSHCGERTTLEAIDLSPRPVSITHANPREYVGAGGYGAGRAKTTEAIKALAKRKGVIGLSPNRNMTKKLAATTLEEFGDMVAWVVDLIGVDAVGIGTDYCPGHPNTVRNWWRYARWSRETAPAESMKIAPHEGWPDWMKTQAGLANVIVELTRRGFKPDEIEKMMSGNWMRIFGETFVPAKQPPMPDVRQRQFYIGGKWCESASDALLDVVNPATEEVFARIAAGNSIDVDRAVAAARAAFPVWAASSRSDRIALLGRFLEQFNQRREDLSQAISQEMGVPINPARNTHFPSGPAHLTETTKVLENFEFETKHGKTLVVKEPIGVCGLITPWNFPINQVMCKIAPALAAGCTMVLKPSEVSPLSALIIAEIMHAAGVPPGVFNLVNGDGTGVGQSIAGHVDVDMVSFTGSTRAGVAVAKQAADTVKRVAQELGGKSANILLPDVDLERAVTLGVNRCFNNSGQSCVAPTRMLVPKNRLEQVTAIARKVTEGIKVGSPADESSMLGPVAHRAQFEKVQRLIGIGVSEGARLAAGGPGRPEGLERGFYVRPTVFVDVHPDMAIAREEIFGPVLAILAYEDEDDAVRIANDTPYGLAAYVQSGSLERARSVARRLRAGILEINYPPVDRGAPFGGYKQSGNGREWGEYGMNEYLEIKGIVGYD